MPSRTLPLLLCLIAAACSEGGDTFAHSAFAGEMRYEPPPADTAPTVTRRVWQDSAQFDAALLAPTPDGRATVLTDWESGDLALLEFGTGAFLHLTTNMAPYVPGLALLPRISRDGTRVAYAWLDLETYRWQIRSQSLDGGAPVVAYDGQDGAYAQPEDWSPDGTRILAARHRDDGRAEVVLLSADGSGEQVVKELGWQAPTRMGLSPDGRWVAYDYPTDAERVERDVFVTSVDGSREFTLMDHPADDRFLGWTPDGHWILVASNRTGTPGAWLFPVDQGVAGSEPILVKPDLWQASGVALTPAGRFYYSVETGNRGVYMVDLDPNTGRPVGSPQEVTSRTPDRTSSPAWSDNGRHVAYIVRPHQVFGAFSVRIRSLESGETREYGLPPRLDSPSGLRWTADSQSLYFRSSDASRRFALSRLDLQTGAVHQVFTPAPRSLMGYDLSADGRTLLYLAHEEPTGESGATFHRAIVARDLTTGRERILHTLTADPRERQLRYPVLSHDGARAAFVVWNVQGPSEIYIASLDGEAAQPIARAGEVESLAFAPGDDHLLVVVSSQQATVGRSPAIAEAAGPTLYRLPVSGGELESTGLTLPGLSDVRVHPGTGRLLYSAGEPEAELWVMEGFLPVSGGR